MQQPFLPDTETRTKLTFANARGFLSGKQEILASLDGLNAAWLSVIFGVAIVALLSRSPSFFTHAQFYAEDGTMWFAQAYNGGWLHSLKLPDSGYLCTIQRIGAGLALLVPFRWAPLTMACVGVVIQALPVVILLSSRCRELAPLPTRLLLAALYVALPNAREIHVVLTNSQWHLALATVLLAFATSPQDWRGRLADSLLFLTAGFCGPFCILLAPIALMFWWLRRQPWSLVVVSLIGIGAATQIFVLLHSAHRTHGMLGARLATFVRMVGGNIVACSLFGSYAFSRLAPMAFLVAAALLGIGVCFYCLRSAPLAWKFFLVYCAALFGASLRSPLVNGGIPAWDLLLTDDSGRYWFFPMLAFVWSGAWCALHARSRVVKAIGSLVLLTMSVGVIRDWRYGAYPDYHFLASVRRLQEAGPGEHVSVPVVPGWTMDLVKKSQ